MEIETNTSEIVNEGGVSFCKGWFFARGGFLQGLGPPAEIYSSGGSGETRFSAQGVLSKYTST